MIGFIFTLSAIYFWDSLPDYGCTDLYEYEPAYHYSRYSSKIGSFLMVCSLILLGYDYCSLCKRHKSAIMKKNEINKIASFIGIYLLIFSGFWALGGFQWNLFKLLAWLSLAISIMLWAFIFGLPNEWGIHCYY